MAFSQGKTVINIIFFMQIFLAPFWNDQNSPMGMLLKGL
jgi:hypothetical protein